MKQFTKKELVELLKQNNTQQPKAKYSNNILLKMLGATDNDFVATLEPTRKGFAFNRGSLCECLVNYAITGKTTKAQAHESDLDTSKVADTYGLPKSSNIEIKYSTSFSPATKKTSKAHYTIIVAESGAYLIESKNLVATESGKININNQKQKYLQPLTRLNQRLGLN